MWVNFGRNKESRKVPEAVPDFTAEKDNDSADAESDTDSGL